MKRKHSVALLEGDFTNSKLVKNGLLNAAWTMNLRVISYTEHEFYPQGYTAIILLAESHLSIHTFPENNEASVDCFTCGIHDPQQVIEELSRQLSARIKGQKSIDREQC